MNFGVAMSHPQYAQIHIYVDPVTHRNPATTQSKLNNLHTSNVEKNTLKDTHTHTTCRK